MSVVFTKTAEESAKGSFLGAAFVTVVGGLFVGTFFLAEGLPTFAKVILLGVGLLSFLWVRSLIREGRSYLRSGRDWRVEITDRKLSWQSPVQEIMASFEIPLSNIQAVRHVRTRRSQRSGSGYRDAYTIERHKGETIKVSDQISGIQPDVVFTALQEAGVPYEKEVIHTKEQFREKRELRRAKRRERRAKRRLQPATVN